MLKKGLGEVFNRLRVLNKTQREPRAGRLLPLLKKLKVLYLHLLRGRRRPRHLGLEMVVWVREWKLLVVWVMGPWVC